MSQIYKASTGGGGGGGITSITGTSGGPITGDNITFAAPPGATIVGNPGTNTLTFTPTIQVFKSPLIDMTTLGTTEMFTLSQPFIVMQIEFYVESIIGGPSTNPINFNIGWTAPDYWDLTGSNAIVNQQTGEFFGLTCNSFQNGTTNESPFILPAGTPIVFNVTGPDVIASSNNQYVYLIGFNLF